MSANDLAAMVVVIVSTVSATFVALAWWDIRRSCRQLRDRATRLGRAADELNEQLVDVIGDARSMLSQAKENVDAAHQAVAIMTETNRLTYRTVAAPVIKAAAVASGVRRGAERLRLPATDADGSASSGKSRSAAGPSSDGGPTAAGKRDRRKRRP